MLILHLVLYSHSDIFDQMYKITRNYYKRFSNVCTIYYAYSETVFKKDMPETGFLLKNDILYIQGQETLIPGVLEKTLKALMYFKDYQCDYVVRSNISTIVQFNLLIPKIMEKKVEYGGPLINECNGLNIAYGVVDDKYHKIKYVSGTCIVFSRQIALNIIKNADKLQRDIVDDISFGNYLSKMPEDALRHSQRPAAGGAVGSGEAGGDGGSVEAGGDGGSVEADRASEEAQADGGCGAAMCAAARQGANIRCTMPTDLGGFLIVKNANTIKKEGFKQHLCYRNRHANRQRDIKHMRIIVSLFR